MKQQRVVQPRFLKKCDSGSGLSSETALPPPQQPIMPMI